MGGTSPQLPTRAPVVPRVRAADGHEALPIEDQVASLLRRGVRGVVSLCGPVGAGKSTALSHLAATVAPELPVRTFDDVTGWAAWDEVALAAAKSLVVVTSAEPCPLERVAQLAMVPWGDDELIEYLLAVHRPQCASVMSRVKASHLPLDGSPELWRIVLDTLARDPAIADVPTALRRCLTGVLSEPHMKTARRCLGFLRAEAAQRPSVPAEWPDAYRDRVTRFRPVQLMLASELIVRNLCDGACREDLEGKLPHDLIVETAHLAAHWPAAVEQLATLAAKTGTRVQPMAVSLLLAINPNWRPGPAAGVPTLSGAYVAGAHWAGVDLHGGALGGVDLERADLSSANLAGASAASANLRNASLTSAKLDKLVAVRSDLANARLTNASAEAAKLREVDLHGADLRCVNLSGADLTHANLADADLTAAKLCDAVLDETELRGADLVGTDFSRAILHRVNLCDANLAGTSFYRADLRSCALEGLNVPKGKFAGAKLTGCYLTGAVMPGADFHSADLRNTGLADVEWEGADLRDADLRGASFHMGSTRSGLVGSPIPCEGSKTGFYTDDFGDREFKNPEEIRKANLCGADLRGAKVNGVDFYLVDLRGARYTDGQRRYFRGCGAILD